SLSSVPDAFEHSRALETDDTRPPNSGIPTLVGSERVTGPSSVRASTDTQDPSVVPASERARAFATPDESMAGNVTLPRRPARVEPSATGGERSTDGPVPKGRLVESDADLPVEVTNFRKRTSSVKLIAAMAIFVVIVAAIWSTINDSTNPATTSGATPTR